MGYGDEIIGTGLARGACERGKRIAFGDGKQIIWGPWCKEIFKGNPNIAAPGDEGQKNLEWIHYYKGNRFYNRAGATGWVWNYEFRVTPGEIYLNKSDPTIYPSGFVFIEPHLKKEKKGLQNKDWGFDNYQKVVDELPDVHFVQCDRGAKLRMLRGAQVVTTMSFRHALNILSKAALYIGPEGGMHHAAAAFGVPGVVIFGGWVPPKVLGYDAHHNLTGNATYWCGSWTTCEHCRKALQSIAVDEVVERARQVLQ